MQVFIRRSMFARFIGALAALSLSAGSAWAGGGGQDAASLQGALQGLCTLFGMAPCPLQQKTPVPPLTQLVLELAALVNAPPENVRFQNAIEPTAAIGAVDPPSLRVSAPGGAEGPSNIAPLAFVNGTVTELGDRTANSFFYAATNGVSGQANDATAINLVFDLTLLRTTSFAKGQPIATFQIPLVTLNNGTETPTPTTIQLVGASCSNNATPPCFSASATGNFGTLDPGKLGFTINFGFQLSDNDEQHAHAVFIMKVPLLVTQATDPAYFNTTGNPLSFASFTGDVVGTGIPPKSQIGFGPVAAKVCASIGQSAQPVVGAYVAIATSATTYLSAPQGTAVTCP